MPIFESGFAAAIARSRSFANCIVISDSGAMSAVRPWIASDLPLFLALATNGMRYSPSSPGWLATAITLRRSDSCASIRAIEVGLEISTVPFAISVSTATTSSSTASRIRLRT